MEFDPAAQIGREVDFACEPYHFGVGRIVKVEACDWPGFFHVEVEAIEGFTVNRLFGHRSDTAFRPGERFDLYRQAGWQIAQGMLRYVYPV